MADQYTPRTKVNIWGNMMVNTVATVHHMPPVSGGSLPTLFDLEGNLTENVNTVLNINNMRKI